MRFESILRRALCTFALVCGFATLAFADNSAQQTLPTESTKRYEYKQDTINERVITIKEVISGKKQDIKFLFEINSSEFKSDFMTNAAQIRRLDELMSDENALMNLDSLEIIAAASIDGSEKSNKLLASNRAETVKSFLMSRYPGKMTYNLIQTNSIPEDWAGLRSKIVADPNVPYKNSVLELIDSYSYGADEKEKKLRTMYGAKPWNYLAENILPQTRYGASLVFHYNVNKVEEIENKQVVVRDSVLVVESYVEVEEAVEKMQYRYAIKTNLLWGILAKTPNLGFEIATDSTHTIDFSFGYNPWNRDGEPGNNKKLVHWLAQIEGRKYLKESFDGHFFGLHVLGGEHNIGRYNLPWLFEDGSENYRYEGWQLGVGLSYGYQWILSPRFNLEASIGLGYMYMEHDKYEHPRCGEFLGSETNHYFGPTRASIAILYRFGMRSYTSKKTRLYKRYTRYSTPKTSTTTTTIIEK